MNPRIKNLFKSWRIIILILFIVFSIVAINPDINARGVAIRSVAQNSSASDAGISVSRDSAQPRSKEVIKSVDNKPVDTAEDYHKIISSLAPNKTVIIKTNKDAYSLRARTNNLTTADLGLSVYNAPSTNIRKGLELQGGTRVLLQPEVKLDRYDIGVLIDTMKERLNVYGLSDIVIREAGDLSGHQYIVVEIAGATEEEIKELLAKQGKFEAKIKNYTIFKGGSDITFVCRSADCSGIDTCGKSNSQFVCGFRFEISTTPEAAQRQADATKDLNVIGEGRKKYLSEKLEFHLDDNKVDELNIGAELKGKPSTQILISGAGSGQTQQAAVENALNDMKRLQTILITGSLPVKLEIIKSDTISPVLGQGFVKNSIWMALAAILSVAVVIMLRYKKIIIALPILLTMLSEVIIILGVAALIGWNIDLASIAGILTAIGTGVDDQIVITDETLRGESAAAYNWREKLKKAFVIILLAYATTVVSMIPLIFSGAGLFKGFAITTIIGVTVGVFITRPAYGAFVEMILK